MNQLCTGATFKTYNAETVEIDLTPFIVREGQVKRKMEQLADEFAHITRNSGDPIVKCIKLKLTEIQEWKPQF